MGCRILTVEVEKMSKRRHLRRQSFYRHDILMKVYDFQEVVLPPTLNAQVDSKKRRWLQFLKDGGPYPYHLEGVTTYFMQLWVSIHNKYLEINPSNPVAMSTHVYTTCLMLWPSHGSPILWLDVKASSTCRLIEVICSLKKRAGSGGS